MIKRKHFGFQDVVENVMGAVLLAFPVAVTEEVWTISESLPLWKALFIAFCSIVTITLFVYFIYYQNSWKEQWMVMLLRVILAYAITLFTAALVLAAIDQLPWMTEPIVALKRSILVALPASFSASVVDSLRS